MRAVPSSLHDDVADRLRHPAFLKGHCSAGASLMRLRFVPSGSISRTPLREALKVLAAEGLVRHEPRRGSFVSEVTEQDWTIFFRSSHLLEGRCAFEATRKATAADIGCAGGTLHLTSAGPRSCSAASPTTTPPTTRIHEAIITLADNRWLAQVDC